MSGRNFNSNRRRGQTPIYAGAKVVGYVKGDTFYKTLRGSKHFLRQPPAISFDVASIRAAEQAGASKIDVLDMETRTHYKTQIPHLWEKGLRLDRGYGAQVALGMDGFVTARYGAPQQLQLFGGG